MEKNLSNLDVFIENTTEDLDKKIEVVIPDEKIVKVLKGGKRLRPLLAHLSFKACTQGNESDDDYQRALEGAVSIELAHSASLVHDDIIDNDLKRRGEPSFHVKEGIASALLTGHKMLATGFNIALTHGKDVAKLYVDSWDKIVNGEIDEVDFNKKDFKNLKTTKTKTLEAYNKIIEQKTAVLFSSACEAGAIEANMSGDVLRVFADYGREVGLAYQLADDLVDLVKGEMIDSVIVPLLSKLENKKILAKSLDVEDVKKLFVKHDSEIRQIFFKEIKKHVKKAEKLSSSNLIPPSKYKNLLNDAPSYITNRMLKEINLKI